MHSYHDILCTFNILQVIIGAFGNGLMLCFCGYSIITGQRIRPIQLIFIYLAFSNTVLILLRGVPWAIHSCIQKIFLVDIKCKIIFYLQRVARGLSLCTTCLLSVFQAITISSGHPIWAELKARASKYIIQFFVFIWVLNLLIDGVVFLYVTGTRNNPNSNLIRNFGLCAVDRYVMTISKLIIWKLLYDAVFVVFMAITSVYMVVVLYRHHWQFQHIHKSSLNPSSSPETRATKTILLLMSTFVCFYSFSSIFIIVMDNSKDTHPWLIHISVDFALCYPTISPFLLICSDSQFPSCFNAFKRMKNNSSSNSENKCIKT
ncbi:vomeronasal type-1 receptor 4-like [Phascolarctos cinereus]|uniref:Vomeronasal type-1 receptor n=1 Tax=Phascolarctos cinereus TaxID=38626 RepID=A0A6P5M6B3_PHACI|nr:vomeronasal type-1 receptor 4-like [Phascolarctos cinereus]